MWLPYLTLIATSVSPVSATVSDIVSYVLGYGVSGVSAVSLVLRIIVPGKSVDEAVNCGLADLLAENLRSYHEPSDPDDLSTARPGKFLYVPVQLGGNLVGSGSLRPSSQQTLIAKQVWKMRHGHFVDRTHQPHRESIPRLPPRQSTFGIRHDQRVSVLLQQLDGCPEGVKTQVRSVQRSGFCIGKLPSQERNALTVVRNVGQRHRQNTVRTKMFMHLMKQSLGIR